MSTKKVLVKTDASYSGYGLSSFAYYVKPVSVGIRGKSFCGFINNGIAEAIDSTSAERIGIYQGIKAATALAHALKIDSKTTVLEVQNDNLAAIRAFVSMDINREHATKSLKALLNKWESVKFTHVSRSNLKAVHASAKHAISDLQDSNWVMYGDVKNDK